MVTEHTNRLMRHSARFGQSRDQGAKGSLLADKAATALPVDEVDVSVDVHQARRARPGAWAAMAEGRQAAEADLRQGWYQSGRNAVPGRHQDRQCTVEQTFQRQPAGAELAQHQHGRPVRAELDLLLGWRGVIDV